MKITIQQIYRELERGSKVQSNIPMELDREIRRIRIVSDLSEVKNPEILYVTLSDPQLWLTGGYYLRPDESTDLPSLINRVQEVFSFLVELEDQLQEIATIEEDYSKLLTTVGEHLDLALLLVDKNLHYLAETPLYRQLNYQWMRDEEDITIEWVNVLEQDEEFMNAINHMGAFPFASPESGPVQITYCFNVRLDQEYAARLLIQNREQSAFHGGLEWARFLGELIQRMFHDTRDRMFQTSEAFRFYEVIQNLAEARPVSPEESLMVLQQAGWIKGNRYQVYLFQPQLKENATVNHRYYQTVLRNLMGACCVFAYGEQICCVRNITATDAIYRDVRTNLSVFLRENLFYVGVSNEFTDILQLRHYFREASDALLTGRKGKSTSWTYYYKDLILLNICRLAQEHLPSSELEHPALRILREYDAAEGTELVKTVLTYMQHQYNVTHTARALFIHRTTLLFRLDRIRLLTGLDWNRLEDRVLLGLNLTQGPFF